MVEYCNSYFDEESGVHSVREIEIIQYKALLEEPQKRNYIKSEDLKL